MTDEMKDQTKIALIQKDISNIQTDISDIKTVLKEGYATKDSLIQVAKETEVRFQNIELTLSMMKNSGNLWKWLSPLLGVVLGSVLTFLVIQYLTSMK